MNIGDVFLALRGDDKQFQADVIKSGDKAAEGFAAQFKSKLGPAIKKAGGALLGAGLGAVFSTAVKGAQELNAATSEFQATVGATTEEAASAQKAIAGLFKTNLQGFGEIGQTLTVLRTDMGLTQKEAEAATESFLKFATATKQNAAAAVLAFDDILDAWGLTASDATGIMDKLIVSNRKFGGSIEDNQKTLAALAPAMRTANLSIDDGIGFLNLFASKGVDADTAVKALQAALTKVKSPEQLQRLITDIGATIDPFQRGQKAVDLFGKSGIKMGQVLEGVTVDLNDYKIGQGEAAGATTETAATIENSFGNQFQLLMKQATGALAEFGAAFGPLLIGASAVFPHLRPVLTAAGGLLGAVFGRALGLGTQKVAAGAIASGVDAAVTRSGSQISGSGNRAGRLLGAGMRIGLLAVVVGVVGLFNDIINRDLERNLRQLNKRASKFISQASIATLKQTRKGLEEELARASTMQLENWTPLSLLGTGGLDLFGGKKVIQDQIDAIDDQLELLNSTIEENARDAAAVAGAFGPGIADGLAAGGPAVAKAAGDLGAMTPAEFAAAFKDATPEALSPAEAMVKQFGVLMGGVKRAARTQGAAGMMALAQGIEEARQKPADAWEHLLEIMKHPLPRWKEQALIIGRLTSSKLQEGLKSNDPVIRATAEGTRDEYLSRLKQISPAGADIGTDAAKKLETALRSNNPAIRKAAEEVRGVVVGDLSKLPNKVQQLAKAAGAGIAPAINSHDNRTDIVNAVKSIVRLITNLLSGIPDVGIGVKVSPSYHFPHKATGGYVPAGQATIVGEYRPEVFVPEVNGRIVPSIGQAERQGIGGTNITNITVPVTGLLRAETPEDVARPLRRLASLGELAGLAPTLRTRTTG